MSYDVWIESSCSFEWNYTSNVAPMWRRAGADLAGFDRRPASECSPALRSAIAAMEADPETYRAMDPPNGWGSYDSVLPRLRDLLAVLEDHPNAIVRVSR